MTNTRFDGLTALLLDLPPEPGEPWHADVPPRLEHLAAMLPGPMRSGMRAATMGLETLSLTMTGKRLHALDGPARGRVLDAAQRIPGAGPVLEALKIPLMLAAGSARHETTRTPHPNPAPEPMLSLTPAADWPDCAIADAIVIGSGAGGAMAARTLARSGLSVIVLEEGRHYPTAELASRPPLDRFTDTYRNAGATLAWGTPPILLPVGRAVGGTTLVNCGTSYRTPKAVLDHWYAQGIEHADPVAFGHHLDEIEHLLRVGPPNDTSVLGRNGRLALLGADRLGWTATPLRRNAPGCGGCCECVAGCPTGAKQAVHLSVLPDACAAGATIVTHATVHRILVEQHRPGPPRAQGVVATRPDGTAFEILAHLVVVAAGATQTPTLLRRSGLGGHPQLGRNLSIHPAVSVAGRFSDPVTGPAAGPNVLQSVGVEEWHHDGILIEATAAPPGMSSFVLPGLGADLRRELDNADHLATLGAMIADRPSGRIVSTSRPQVRYQLHPDDGTKLLAAIHAAGRVLLAAGAHEVITGLPGVPVARNDAELEDAIGRATHRQLHLSAFHPTGTAAMGADDQRAPVTESGMLRGVSGVLIADASLLPTCPRVNPQLTIMAMAMAVTQQAVSTW